MVKQDVRRRVSDWRFPVREDLPSPTLFAVATHFSSQQKLVEKYYVGYQELTPFSLRTCCPKTPFSPITLTLPICARHSYSRAYRQNDPALDKLPRVEGQILTNRPILNWLPYSYKPPENSDLLK